MLHAACVLADYSGTVEVSNRTEVRGRATQGQNLPLGLDMADIPTLRLGAADRHWKYTLGYSATAILPDLELGLSPQLMQTAEVGVAWRDRHVELGLAEYGQYGLQNSAYLLSGSPSPATPAPTVGGVQGLTQPKTLTIGGSRTALTGRYQLARHAFATSDVEYAIQGGLDAGSQAFLPLLRGPRAELTLGFDVSRLDIVETRVQGVHSDADPALCSPFIVGVTANEVCAPTSQSVQLTEVWRHRVTHFTELSFGAGASYAQARLAPDKSYFEQVYPVVTAGLQHVRTIAGQRTFVHANVDLSPYLDYRTGILDERAEGSISLEVPVHRIKYTGLVGAARSVGSSLLQPLTTFQAYVEAEWLLTRMVSVGAGVRYAWQQQEAFGTFSGEMLFGEITVRTLPTHF